MHNTQSIWTVIGITALLWPILGGCVQSSFSPTASPATTEAASPTVSLTPTATLSPAPTATPTATAMLIPPLPSPVATHALTHAIVDNVFFGGSSPGCELPCWHGLVIGSSTSDDVKAVFDRVFNFGGLPYLDAADLPSPSGYIILGHAWQQGFIDGPMTIFSAIAVVSRETGRLEALEFGVPLPYISVRYARFHPDLSPGRVIRELGQPFYWQMALRGGGQGEGVNVTLTSFMVYDNGLSFYHSAEFPAKMVSSNGSAFMSAQFCMNDNLPVTADISRPLVSGFAELSPLEEERIYGIRKELSPMEQVIGITSEELVKRMQTETNSCITLKVSG